MLNSPVAVGVTDGQNPDVVRFALEEAMRLDRPLRVVHVVETSSREGLFVEHLGHDLQDLLEAVPIERVTLFGDAESVLLAESGTVCRLVLGADDLALSPAHWSEVAQRVALQATVPVVVVPASSPPAATSHVLVAVDDAQSFEGQLAYAFEAAEQRGVALCVVFGAGTMSDYPGRLRHLDRVEEILDGWRTMHPTVQVDVSVDGGNPVDSCLQAGTHASLMVIGRPAGKHPRVGSRSVASRILRAATVPVAVVPLDYTTPLAPDLLAVAGIGETSHLWR